MTDRPFPLVGGAEISIALLLSQLQSECGHTCRLAGQSPYARSIDAFGIHIESFRDDEELAERARAFRPDVLFSSLVTSIVATRVALRFGVRHVTWHPSYELAPPTRAEALRWGVDPDREYPARAMRDFVHRHADAVFTNSRHMQRWFRARAGVASRVIHPSFEPDVRSGRGRAAPPPLDDRRRRYVTAVAGYDYKGAAIVAGLADALPDVEFMVAGRVSPRWRSRFEAQANVTLRPFGPPAGYLDVSRLFLVPSQWPEPFGRVAVESMAAGVPTIVSRTGGLADIAGPGPASVASFRSIDAWRRGVERVLSDAALARRLATAGRRRAAPFLTLRSAHLVDRVVRRLAARATPDWSTRTVAISGSISASTAFAAVNAHWTRELAGRSGIAIDTSRRGSDGVTCPADVHVRSDFTRPFDTWEPPPDGHLVAVRTWDFGPFPRAWVDRIVADYDRLWVHTRWIRDQAIASGVPADRVTVVPLGVDLRTFRPEGPVTRLASHGRRRPFTFLFVGAPVARKGFDILMHAWRQAFCQTDDVRLVIKANPRDVFYGGARQADALRAAQRDREAAPIVFLDRYLTPSRLAALYRAADAGVFPYRAEGFCLPILESMACGTPVIAPRFGAALDFCTDRNAWLVPARRIAVPVQRSFAINSLGFEQEVDAVDFCEVAPDVLAARLRAVVAGDARARRDRAARAVTTARRFSWQASADRVVADVRRLARQGPPCRFLRSREAAERHRRMLLTAEELYLSGSRL